MRQVTLWAALCLFMAAPCLAQCTTDCDGDKVDYPTDCNDADPDIFPGAAEVCDGRDNNCDGQIDEDLPSCISTCDLPDRLGLEARVSIDAVPAAASSLGPSLTWSGTEFALAWNDDRDGSLEIFFTGLDDAGQMIGSNSQLTSSNFSTDASLVWTGSRYGVAWYDERNSGVGEIYFARLDSNGMKLGGDLRITDTVGMCDKPPGQSFGTCTASKVGATCFADIDCHAFPSAPAIAWNGQEFGIVWYDEREQNREIYFARVDVDGTRIGEDLRVTDDPARSMEPSLVWNGTEYGIAWQDDRTDAPADPPRREIYFTRLGFSTEDPPEIGKIGGDVRITDDAAFSSAPALAWTGTEFGIAWHDSRDGAAEIYFARVGSDGTKIGDDFRVTGDPGFSLSPELAWTGAEYGVVWQDDRIGNREIFFTRLGFTDDLSAIEKNGGDVRLTHVQHAVAPNSSASPRIVWTGSEYGVAWEDNGDTTWEIYFARVLCDCVDFDGDSSTVCSDCNEDMVFGPNIFPGAADVCDGFDTDCSESSLESDPDDPLEIDGDGDGYLRCDGYVEHGAGFSGGGDCDDTEAKFSPGEAEICDGFDTDCSGGAAPETDDPLELDDDLDGYIECGPYVENGQGLTGGDDCDDQDITEFPGQVWYPNCDGDLGFSTTPVIACSLEEATGGLCERTTGTLCTLSVDCPETGLCGVRTETGCDLDAPNCPDEQICLLTGLCSDTTETTCVDDSECLVDEFCFVGGVDEDGLCVATTDTVCASDFGCPSDETCLQTGRCAATTETVCVDDVGCPDGEFCLDVAQEDCLPPILTPCADNELPDGRGGVCMRVCTLGLEEMLGEECTMNTDCGGGGFGVCAPLSCIGEEQDVLTGEVRLVGKACEQNSDCNRRWSNVAGIDCNDEDDSVVQELTWGPDCDGDGGFATKFQNKSVVACGPAGADLVSTCDGGVPPIGGWRRGFGNDCNDENPLEFKGQVWYPDCDGDGEFHQTFFAVQCSETQANGADACLADNGYTGAPLGGWIHVAGDDCDDTDPAAFPGATEICDNSIDENCNGLVDDVADGVCDTGTGLCTAGNVDAICTLDSECDLCVTVPITAPPEVVDLNLDGTLVNWQTVPEMPAYNVYRGDVAVLRDTGLYTQDPAVVPLAASMCGLFTSPEDDPYTPPPGQVVFYLVSADNGAAEGILGASSAGIVRANQNPCP